MQRYLIFVSAPECRDIVLEDIVLEDIVLDALVCIVCNEHAGVMKQSSPSLLLYIAVNTYS